MIPAVTEPDETFAPAPLGLRVRVVLVLVSAVFVAAAGLNAWFMPREPATDYWIAVGAPLAGLPIVAITAWFSRIRALRLEGGDLVVVRAAFPVRFSLAGLSAVEMDPDPLAGARKLIGNDGLGAVSGRYRAAKYGVFRAYLTDRERGVVLRAAAGTVVLSPAQREAFIESVRRRARAVRAGVTEGTP